MFSKQLARFNEKTMERHAKLVRASVLELGSVIVHDTPVKTGVLKNNWYVAIGTPSSEKTNQSDESGSAAINRMQTKLDAADIGADIFITNNLDYAGPVEFNGTSGGMARRGIALWDQIVARQARRLK